VGSSIHSPNSPNERHDPNDPTRISSISSRLTSRFNSVARVILDDGHFVEQIKAYETDPVFWKLEHDGKDLAEYWGCLALETTKQ